MFDWIKNLFKPREVNIWKDVKCEFLRRQRDWGTCPQEITDMYVYAITQFCLNTGKVRICEKFDYFEIKEFDILEDTRKTYFLNK